eukprot:jgi/Ulvmu1/8364/UM042_0070.1
MSDQLEIEATDVIKIILQFCKEHGMNRSYDAIQEDCQVCLNTVENVDQFLLDINQGRWDAVLPQITHLRLPTEKLYDLYEQIVCEMIELRETDTARAMLRTMKVFKRLQHDDAERFMRLDRMSNPTYMDLKELYGGEAKEKRRSGIAHALAQEVTSVPASRLMNIIGDALRWKKHLGTLPQGTGFDLLNGTARRRRDDVELYPTSRAVSLPFGKATHPEAAAFMPDGDSLVTGSVDGFVEVWDINTGKLRTDLAYQASDEYMMHDKPVLCLCLSRDGVALASGDQGGCIKVWKLATGRCLQRFERAHGEGVTSVAFSIDSTHVLSASFDGSIRVHGLRSGRMLKEFRGHKSYVNCAIYSLDGAHVYSASSDGTVGVWDAKSCECLKRINPTPGAPTEVAVNSVMLNPIKSDELLVCTQSNAVHSMAVGGAVAKTWTTGRSDANSVFVAAATSPRGAYLYALALDGNLYCFNIAQGRLDHVLEVAAKGKAIGLAHHPHRNFLATVADESELKCWHAAGPT